MILAKRVESRLEETGLVAVSDGGFLPAPNDRVECELLYLLFEPSLILDSSLGAH